MIKTLSTLILTISLLFSITQNCPLPNCALCVTSTLNVSSCNQCDVGFKLHSFDNQQCICANNYYNNNVTCIKCDIQCATCDADGCTWCHGGMELQDNDCLCQDDDQSINYSTGRCQSPSDETESGIKLGVVLSIVLVGVVTVAVIICFICFMRIKSNQRSRRVSQQNPVNSSNIIPISLGNTSLLQFKNNHQFKQETCSICLDQKPMFLTLCGHYFHEKCIYGWLMKRQVCPNCNQTIKDQPILKWCDKCKSQILMPTINQKRNQKDQLVTLFSYLQYCQKCAKGIKDQKMFVHDLDELEQKQVE